MARQPGGYFHRRQPRDESHRDRADANDRYCRVGAVCRKGRAGVPRTALLRWAIWLDVRTRPHPHGTSWVRSVAGDCEFTADQWNESGRGDNRRYADLPKFCFLFWFRNSSLFIHRASPGTVVYNDAVSLAQLPPELEYQPAALVLTRV